MPKKSRDKGARGELDVVNLFREVGIDARRSVGRQPQAGRSSEPDVVLPANLPLWVEVKVGAQTVQAAFDQAVESARGKTIPIAFARRDKDQFLVAMRPAMFFFLLRKAWPHVFQQTDIEEFTNARTDQKSTDVPGGEARPDGDDDA